MAVKTIAQIKSDYGVSFDNALQIQHNQLLEDQIGELTMIRKALEKSNEPKSIDLGTFTKEEMDKMMGKNLTAQYKEPSKRELFEQIKRIFRQLVSDTTKAKDNVVEHRNILTHYQEELLTLLNLPRE